MFRLETAIRPHLLTLQPYASARDDHKGNVGTFLDANENSLASPTYNRYPDPHHTAIRERLAPLKGVREAQIILGNGSDEPIDLLTRAFCEPTRDKVMILPPTYGMYEVSAGVHNVETQRVNLTPDFQLDVEAILAAVSPQTKILWLCSPNNPTGAVLKKADILAIVAAVSCIVVVDEAYIDFAPETSVLHELDAHPNLVVLQTFSKAWGLAGLRVGMCFASEEIIKILYKIKSPYNLNVHTQKVVWQALANPDAKNKAVEILTASREKLQKKLELLSIVERVYPSNSNQLLVKFTDAQAVFGYLLEKEIIVRDRSKAVHCENCLRISIGTEAEMENLFTQLHNLQEQK